MNDFSTLLHVMTYVLYIVGALTAISIAFVVIVVIGGEYHHRAYQLEREKIRSEREQKYESELDQQERELHRQRLAAWESMQSGENYILNNMAQEKIYEAR